MTVVESIRYAADGLRNSLLLSVVPSAYRVPMMKVSSVASAPPSSREREHGRASLGTCDTDDADDSAYRYGQVYDSHLASEPERRRFWSADRKGFVSYVRVGRHVKVGGGLLAPPESREQLLREFVELCRRERWTISFFTISDVDVPLFKQVGFEVTKWGEDPIVELADWTCCGKSFEWLRRQENYCLRHELRCDEWRPDESTPAERLANWTEIEAVSREWLADKPQAGPLGFFNGEPSLQDPSHQRIFLVRADQGRGRLEAFVFAHAFQAGAMWALDIYRHRTDAVRGAIPFAMLHALRVLKQSGVRAVSLCMVATLGCGPQPGAPTSWLTKVLGWAGRCLSPLVDLAGMYHYKSRFRPRFEPRYVCVWPRASLMNTLTTFYVTGITNISLRKTLRRAWSQWRSSQRRTLAAYVPTEGTPLLHQEFHRHEAGKAVN